MCESSCREFFTRHPEEKEAALYYGRDLRRKMEKYRLPEIVPFSLYHKESSGTRHYRCCVRASWKTAGYDTGLTHVHKWNKWSIWTPHCIVCLWGYRTALPWPGIRLWGTVMMVISLVQVLDKYPSAPVSTGNTFQGLPRLRETVDNTERYIRI
jgi:hypothetical protein